MPRPVNDLKQPIQPNRLGARSRFFRTAAYCIYRFITSLPLKGVPASLGPGLRTVSGAILRPTTRARISPVRHLNPDRVYLRAAVCTSPVVACPPAATHRGQVHQWINAFQPNNSPTFSKLFQRPRPFQAGPARSASRSVVTIFDLDPASDPGRRAIIGNVPPKTPSDFRRCSLSNERSSHHVR